MSFAPDPKFNVDLSALNKLKDTYLKDLNQEQFGNIIRNATPSSLSSMNPMSIINSLPSTKKLFQNPSNTVNEILNSTSKEVSKYLPRSDQTLNDLSSNLSGTNGGAVQQATTFITNTSKESVLPFELPGVSGPFDLGTLGKEQLSKLANYAGLSGIANNSDLTKALSTISNEFGNISNTATNFANQVIPGSSGMFDNLFNSTGTSSGFNVLDSIKNIVDDYVPDGLKEYIGPLKDNTSTFTNSLAGLLNGLPGVGLSDSLSDLVKNTNQNYPSITDKSGATWSGMNSNSTYSLDDTTKLYANAKSLCPDISGLDNLIDFSKLKSLYDALVAMALNNGLTDLLSSLLNCGEKIYNDTRTYDILASRITSAAQAGDLSSLNMIADYAGVGRFSNPIETLRTAATNIDGSPSSILELKSLANKLGIKDTNQLVYSSNSTNYSAPAIATMNYKNTDTLSQIVDSDIINTAVAVLDKYKDTFGFNGTILGI